jgi:hypothetical protein
MRRVEQYLLGGLASSAGVVEDASLVDDLWRHQL